MEARQHIKEAVIADIEKYFSDGAEKNAGMIATPEAKEKFYAKVAHLLEVANAQPAEFYDCDDVYGGGRTQIETVLSAIKKIKPLL